MKAARFVGPIVIGLLLAPAARADQCSYITKAQAVAAFERLSIGKTIYEFCELCGDKNPKPVVINSLAISNTKTPGYWQVMVNGKGIDLAYTYIDYGSNKSDGRRVNLALVANCLATDFTPILPSAPLKSPRR
jgi:hypothetical protein